MAPASRRDARISPRGQSQISHGPSPNAGFKLCRTETKKEAEPQALKILLLVPPGHAGAATALNAKMSKLQALRLRGIKPFRSFLNLARWERTLISRPVA